MLGRAIGGTLRVNDQQRRRFEGLERGRRGRFHLQLFRSDPGATSALRRYLRFAAQFVLAAAALATGILVLFPLAWERQAHPCAALEALVWRRTLGAMRVPDAARPTQLPGITLIVRDGPMPRPMRCLDAYWRRL